MPIPDLNQHGLLALGIHDCTLEELEERFGDDRLVENRVRICRSRLYKRLCDYVKEVRRLGYAIALLVDGSFVTDKPEPEDIDLVLILPPGHDFTQDVRPFEYNVLSKRRVRQNRFPFDLFVVAEGSTQYDEAVALFHKVKGRPGLTKGFLRVRP